VLRTGKFVEVGREDLVGRYVGHTAIKTAEKIKEAEEGILFIDEAYSLDSNSSIDYGHEAINTLVKHMEDKRDNLVVIFAGYPKEMLKFITMNPGLRERIQFKLEFVDYKANELFEIWKKFFESSEYQIDKDALYEMERISNKLYENRDSNFSNGRIIRKCFERAKMNWIC
jgi:SpoVK/Ycf46/Vps4 family AAA+-type ATPase